MTDNKKRKTPRERREKRERQKEEARHRAREAELFVRIKEPVHLGGYTIPAGVILADLDEQAENNSYSPPLYYEDVPFVCRDCGSEEVWTAEQQKWYYEIAKGPIYAGAVRCRDCRQKERERKQQSQQPRRAREAEG